MNEGLKFLVIAACVVVVGLGGWFAWQRYAGSGQRDADQARVYLFNRAGAAAGDTERVEAFCKTTLEHVAGAGTDNAFIKDDADACRMLNFGQ
jgi:hypothetical protein